MEISTIVRWLFSLVLLYLSYWETSPWTALVFFDDDNNKLRGAPMSDNKKPERYSHPLKRLVMWFFLISAPQSYGILKVQG